MGYRIPADRTFIFQKPEQDIYFHDGHICVTSGAITIGNPPTNTISIQNLNGVSLSQEKVTPWSLVFWSLGSLLFIALVVVCFFSDNWRDYLIFIGSLGLIAGMFIAKLIHELLPRPWDVTIKIGGMMADEVFSNPNQEWAEKFAQAVSYALSVEQHRRGGGGQAVPQAPIFPSPTLGRN